MMQLNDMTKSEFINYKPLLVEGYAQDIARNARIPIDEARAKSNQQIDGLLSEGLSTPKHFLYTIQVKDGKTDAQIGYLWLNVDKHSCFILDIYLDEAFRGQGWGKKTLELLEIQMTEQNIQKISLHVFGDNTAARGLYTKLGYQVTGLNMQKWLEVKTRQNETN
jgi:ribosomal protein S18 acetylase RimI-like enzyme